MSVGGADNSGSAESSAKAAEAASKAAEAASKAAEAAAKAEKAKAEKAKAEQSKTNHGLADFFKDLFEPAPKTSPTSPKPSAEIGVNAAGAYAGVAAVKGRDPKTGLEVDLFSASIQVGRQNEVQAGMARVGFSSDDGVNAIRGDIFTGHAGFGTQNPDGSIGINAGASVTAVGIEMSAGYSGYSAAFGASAGLGLEGSIGWRDIDGDGRPEVCVRGSAGPVTVGVCIEK